MVDIAALADRAATGTQALAGLGARLARGVVALGLLGTAACGLLAVFALSGDGTAVALVLTALAAAAGVGASGLAWWRLRQVDGRTNALREEFHQLFARDETASRTVIDTVERGQSDTAPARVVGTRQFGAVRGIPLHQLQGLTSLTDTFRALARFPALLAVAVLGVFLLGGLSLVFLLASLL